MNLHAYGIDTQMRLEPVEVDRLDLGALADRGPLWLAIDSADEGEIEKLLAPLELHPLVLAGCLETGDRLRLELIEREVFFSYPAGGVADRETPYTRIVCRRDLLVTIRDRPIPELDAKLHRAAIRLRARSVAAIVIYLLGINQQDNVRAALTLRDDVNRVADRIDDDLEGIDGGDIKTLKQRAAVLSVMFEDQAASLSTLRKLGADVLEEAFRTPLGRRLEGNATENGDG